MRGPAAGRRGPYQGLWTDRTVAWYERANARSDYAAQVLTAAKPVLGGCDSALDVGAGFGALALPLARRLRQVTALEPAPAMAAALRRAAARAGLANIAVIEAAWEETTLAPHDLVLCAHVGPLLGGRSAFLAAVSDIARRAVVLVLDAGSGNDKFHYGELYPRLLGRPYGDGRPCRDAETLAALAALGITPAVTPIEYGSDQPFDSLDEACDFWMTYMRLEGDKPRTFLREFLASRLRRDGGVWVAPLRRRATVVWWRP